MSDLNHNLVFQGFFQYNGGKGGMIMNLLYPLAVSSVAVIGAADGPTSIFIAGKVSTGSIVGFAAVVLLAAFGLFWYFKKRK